MQNKQLNLSVSSDFAAKLNHIAKQNGVSIEDILTHAFQTESSLRETIARGGRVLVEEQGQDNYTELNFPKYSKINAVV